MHAYMCMDIDNKAALQCMHAYIDTYLCIDMKPNYKAYIHTYMCMDMKPNYKAYIHTYMGIDNKVALHR